MTDQNSTAAPNTVVGQNPPEGTMMAQGATVRLSASPSGSTIPDVVGEKAAVLAGAKIRGSGRRVKAGAATARRRP